MNVMEMLEKEQMRGDIPDFNTGDTIKVFVRIVEGQKQRISIARAIVKSPDILIMDEPTSALDNVTEHSIYAMLPDAVKGKTLFTIAHRLNTVKSADKILFMREGQQPLCGLHDELMKIEEYKNLFESS